MTDRPTLYLSIALLASYNIAANLWLAAALYVPTNLALAVLLLWLAARAGAGPRDIGILRERLGTGWRFGLAVGTVVAVVLVAGAIIPGTRSFFDDERATEMSIVLLLYHTLIRIPLGTALFEELAFRGVVYGLGKRVWTSGQAAVVSSALFGLWHILPTLQATDGNVGVADAVGSAPAVVAGVVGTFVAGLFFVWVRERADSLLAPVVVHAVTNGVALTLAFIVT